MRQMSSIRIFGRDRKLVRQDTRVAPCRCGASENKPFCDGSHRKMGSEPRRSQG